MALLYEWQLGLQGHIFLDNESNSLFCQMFFLCLFLLLSAILGHKRMAVRGGGRRGRAGKRKVGFLAAASIPSHPIYRLQLPLPLSMCTSSNEVEMRRGDGKGGGGGGGGGGGREGGGGWICWCSNREKGKKNNLVF